MPSSSLLSSLPLEIFRNIFHRLEFQDKVRLTMTDRCLRNMIEPPVLEDFLSAESHGWAVARSLYTCRGCVSFRQHDHFADDMRKGRRARGGLEAGTRLCIRCGVGRGLYSEGMEITFKGQRAVLGRIRSPFTDHAVCSSISCGSTIPVWVSNRKATTYSNQHYRQFAHEDEWVRSKLSYAGSRDVDEVARYWLDI